MNLSRIPYLSVTAALALSGYASQLHAGEKIQFSGKKEKNSELAAPGVKPLLPTLDFQQITGRGKSVSPEQLIPVPISQQEEPVDTKKADKKKKEKDWVSMSDKNKDKDSTGQEDKNDKDSDSEKDQDYSKDKNNRDKKTDREKDRERERNNAQSRNPFDNRTASQKELDPYGSGNGSSTNRLNFGSSGRNRDNPFESRSGNTTDNAAGGWTSRARGAQENPFAGSSERAETHRLLGMTPSSATENNGASVTGGASSTINLFNGAPATTGNTVSRPAELPVNRSDSFNQNNGQLTGRDSGFKPSGMGDLGPSAVGFNSGGPSVPTYEVPRMDRKPAILPVPQRKF